MSLKVSVRRNAGHPWDSRPGFDLLFLDADTPDEMERGVAMAKAKFWEPWLIGEAMETGKPGGVMYKPCGAMCVWEDSPDRPHAGNEIF